MANPLLKRYSLVTMAANTYTSLVPAVATGRALAISKIIVVNVDVATGNFYLRISGTTRIVSNFNLAAGAVYSEAGIVLAAGDYLEGYAGTANGMQFNVFGEEVDNV